MATILSMPKWGLAMKSGLVVEWLKKSGETIEEGEPLLEVESEKATNEVESPASGTLRWIGIPEGEKAPVGEPIAIIAAPGEELSDEQITALLRAEAEEKQRKAEATRHPRTSPTGPGTSNTTRTGQRPSASSTRANASPAARRLAQEMGVDLSQLSGSGPGGMIGREDVLRAAKEMQEPPSQEAQEQVVMVNGIATHCLLAGPSQAPHVVFIHGLGGSLATWSLNLPAFAGAFRICALDLVGAGESDRPEMDYSVDSLTAFLAQFLQELGADWQRVSLIGHSLGGAIALTFAQCYPERVERLILIDSAGLGSEIDATLLHLMRSEPSHEHIEAELACFFANADLVQHALVEQIYQLRQLPGMREALRATLEAAFGDDCQHIDLRTAFAEITIPTLVFWGASDHVIPVSHIQDMLPDTFHQFTVFPNCGHCPHIEQSDAFNQQALAFLKA